MSSWFALIFSATLFIPYLTKDGYNRGKLFYGSYLLWGLFILLKKETSFKKVQAKILQRKNDNLLFLGWLIVVLLNAAGGRGVSGWFQMHVIMYMFLFIFMNMTYSTMRPELLNGLKVGIILMLGVQAAISLPTLYENLGIAREVMQGPDNLKYELGIMHGVGEYSLYTSLAIGFPMMLGMAFGVSGVKKILVIASIVAILISILLSTFTAASFVVITGIILMMVAIWTLSRERFLKRLFYVFISIGLVFGMIYLIRDTSQFQFVWLKGTQIISGSYKLGVVAGDDSQRGSLALVSLNAFLDNPFFGIGPYFGSESYDDLGSHCSWIDGLAEYGLFGFGFYILFIGAIFVQLCKNFRASHEGFIPKARFISLFLFIIAGIINPIIFSTNIIFLFFFFVLTRPLIPVKRTPQKPIRHESLLLR